MGDRPPGALSRRIWWAAFGICGALVVVRNLFDLSGSPPGFYVDEASIGYNAWTVAHYGVDEHGTHLPLFFEAFGDYKNPVYVYVLSALLRLLPLTPTVERLPAAGFGLAAILFLTLAAWRLTRSRWITMLALGLTAFTPWLIQESRVGFETISMLGLLCAGLWCLAGPATSPRRFTIAGALFGLAIFGYTTARLEILLFSVAFVAAWAWTHPRGWWRTLVPIGAGYVLLGVWGQLNPGALTARFNLISVAADGAPAGVVVHRFLDNYVSYFSPSFLFQHGDLNLRHNTGVGGMLLWVTAPLMLAGFWSCWLRRRQPFTLFLLLCIILAPIGAALTNESVPHALRSADLMPFLLLLAVLGADRIRLACRDDAALSGAVVTAVAVGLISQATVFAVDMYGAYPARAGLWFDSGELAAIGRASALAGGHTVYLSSTLDAPYIEAFVSMLPPPPDRIVADNATPGLARLGMRVADPVSAEHQASPGDLIVLSAYDAPPAAALILVDVELSPENPLDPQSQRYALATVYRLGG